MTDAIQVPPSPSNVQVEVRSLAREFDVEVRGSTLDIMKLLREYYLPYHLYQAPEDFQELQSKTRRKECLPTSVWGDFLVAALNPRVRPRKVLWLRDIQLSTAHDEHRLKARFYLTPSVRLIEGWQDLFQQLLSTNPLEAEVQQKQREFVLASCYDAKVKAPPEQRVQATDMLILWIMAPAEDFKPFRVLMDLQLVAPDFAALFLDKQVGGKLAYPDALFKAVPPHVAGQLQAEILSIIPQTKDRAALYDEVGVRDHQEFAEYVRARLHRELLANLDRRLYLGLTQTIDPEPICEHYLKYRAARSASGESEGLLLQTVATEFAAMAFAQTLRCVPTPIEAGDYAVKQRFGTHWLGLLNSELRLYITRVISSLKGGALDRPEPITGAVSDQPAGPVQEELPSAGLL
jgi:hypothetical protein